MLPSGYPWGAYLIGTVFFIIVGIGILITYLRSKKRIKKG